LFGEVTPAICCARGGSYAAAVYGCGDACGLGFGSAFVANGNDDEFEKFDNDIAY
jgi:hypothetical protein